jgi:hypothetical protein
MGPPLDDTGGRGAERPRSSLLRGAFEQPRTEDRDRRSSSGGVGGGRLRSNGGLVSVPLRVQHQHHSLVHRAGRVRLRPRLDLRPERSSARRAARGAARPRVRPRSGARAAGAPPAAARRTWPHVPSP